MSQRWLKLFWPGYYNNGVVIHWAGLDWGRAVGRIGQFYLASVKSESRMKNECGLWIFQLRSVSLQPRYNSIHLMAHREAWWSGGRGALLLCPDVEILLASLFTPVTAHCPFPKEQSFQLCWPLFILPGGSCLDIVFHSLLIEFCFFFKKKFNFKVLNRLTTWCQFPKVLTISRLDTITQF